MPRLIQVIESHITRGEGKPKDDPCRQVVQYHTTDGELLAERDEWAEIHMKRIPRPENEACANPYARSL